MAPYYPLIL